MSRKGVTLLVLALLALGATTVVAVVAVSWQAQAGDGVDRGRVVLGTVEARMMATGTLLPKTRRTLAFQAPGRVDDVLVAPREPVRQGQLLATLDAVQLEAAVRRRAFDLERAQWRARSPARLATDDEVQVHLAALDVEQARFELAMAEALLDGAALRAPVDGTVAHVGIQAGDLVGGTPGAAQIIIAADDRWVIEIEGEESEIRRARPGARATVFFPAPDAAVVAGTVDGPPVVRRIATGPAAATALALAIALDRNPGDLQIGRTARAEIVVDAREQVPVVPLQAVFRHDGRERVLVWQDARWMPVVVSLGLIDEYVAELVEGPPVGAVVAVAPSQRLRELARLHH